MALAAHGPVVGRPSVIGKLQVHLGRLEVHDLDQAMHFLRLALHGLGRGQELDHLFTWFQQWKSPSVDLNVLESLVRS